MQRAYYIDIVSEFICKKDSEIFGDITRNDAFAADDLQKNTWAAEINILKKQLHHFKEGHILFEYTIPRIGNRIDAVLLYQGIVFLLEFKVGGCSYPSKAVEQVTDYALDLSCFHKESHDKLLVPILISTNAPDSSKELSFLSENILTTYCCNKNNIEEYIIRVCNEHKPDVFLAEDWINSIYMPTPTIIEAAQVLYNGHNVEDISRNDASAVNLLKTTNIINKIVEYSKGNKRKSICFITGVPGAGKTLAGLNIAVSRQKVDEDEHAVFLAGNGPLVAVLHEALARDDMQRSSFKIKKPEALRKVKEFIQIIHHFRDHSITAEGAPIEKVVVYDEAQRAWDENSLRNFMKRKKNRPDFNMSEPDFLISVMDRHTDWSTIVCLIGGGQEINTGEAGLAAWFNSLRHKYKNWDVYVSDRISGYEYTNGETVSDLVSGLNCKIISELHLSVSLRSFRSENVSSFVKALLDIDVQSAISLLSNFQKDYPVCMTRNIQSAKKWILEKAKGSQRYGMIASSGAKRLREYGIWVENKIDAPNWFLNDRDDVRSSYFLEETATEFDIQGLELDWALMCWDANLRFAGNKFTYHKFRGTKWQNINKPEV